jgi:hypothetical protein
MSETFASIDAGKCDPERHGLAMIASLKRISVELREIANLQDDYGWAGSKARREDMFGQSGACEDWITELEADFAAVIARTLGADCDLACDARREEALA